MTEGEQKCLNPSPLLSQGFEPRNFRVSGRPWVGRGSVSSPLVEKFQKLY